MVPQASTKDIDSEGLQLKSAYCQPAAAAATATVSDLRSTDSQAASALTYAESNKPFVGSQEVKAPASAALSVCKSLVAGGLAGGVSRSAVAPLERLKILLQVQNAHNAKYTGMVQGLRYIWAHEGLRGFFKGNGTNCARIIPNSAVKFYSYEQAADGILWLHRRQSNNPDAELTPFLRLCAGATAGIIAMSATYPMDMVRGRITVQNADSPHQYRGMLHAMSTVIREEGPRALYKGWVPSVIGVVPYVGLNFAVYETLKDWVYKAQPVGEQSDLTVITKLGCGAAAGTVGQTVAYPLDVVRRRLQMVGWKSAAPVLTPEGTFEAPMQYKGMLDCFSKTVKHEGVSALYKGLVPNCVKVVPSIAIAFVTYEVVKDVLGVEIRISD